MKHFQGLKKNAKLRALLQVKILNNPIPEFNLTKLRLEPVQFRTLNNFESTLYMLLNMKPYSIHIRSKLKPYLNYDTDLITGRENIYTGSVNNLSLMGRSP